MIDLKFMNINSLLVLSFKNSYNDLTRDSFDKYHLPKEEVKDFNSVVYKKPFFDQPAKNKQEEYEKLVERSRNNNYKTGSLLHSLYHKNVRNLLV